MVVPYFKNIIHVFMIFKKKMIVHSVHSHVYLSVKAGHICYSYGCNSGKNNLVTLKELKHS